MKLTKYILAVAISAAFAYHQQAVDYSLLTIRYEASSHIGSFLSIFYDISTDGFFEPILEDLASDPSMKSIARIVIRRPFSRVHQDLPPNPSLILINPGSDEAMTGQGNRISIAKVLGNFNPVTKILVFVDLGTYNQEMIETLLVWVKFNNVVMIDKRSGKLSLNCLKYSEWLNYWPHPKDLFEWHKRELRGGSIYYVPGRIDSLGGPMKWLRATSQFLNTKLVMYRASNPLKVDIYLDLRIIREVNVKLFHGFFTTEIDKGRILVPKGRQLYTVEMMLMPFSWSVWLLLLIVMILAEAVKRFEPNLIRNDPVLLVVCGFERHNLHQADRWEKITLLSLIVLMFFMTNAFESKIISLMIDKPTVQPIESLEDFDKHGIKIFMDLKKQPHVVNDSAIGKYVVHGMHATWETIPGAAMFVKQDVADSIHKLSFDFERGEPWFEVLDQEFLMEIGSYELKYRSPLLETFKFTYNAFYESGLFHLHTKRFNLAMYYDIQGRRPRKYKENKIYLKFNDMILAWIALGIGLSVSLAGLVGELTWKKLEGCFGKARTVHWIVEKIHLAAKKL